MSNQKIVKTELSEGKVFEKHPSVHEERNKLLRGLGIDPSIFDGFGKSDENQGVVEEKVVPAKNPVNSEGDPSKKSK